MGLLRRTQNPYLRIDKEDPEERQHIKARFLIHKILEEAETQRRIRSSPRLRVCRIKRRIGLRLSRLRLAISKARLRVCHQVMKPIRHLKLVLPANQKTCLSLV